MIQTCSRYDGWWRKVFCFLIPLSKSTFWLHCLLVTLTDTSPPLESGVRTASAMLSKWKSQIQTGGSRGTWERKYFSSSTNLCLSVQRHIWQSYPILTLSFVFPIQYQEWFYFPQWTLQSFFPKNQDREEKESLWNVRMTKLWLLHSYEKNHETLTEMKPNQR